MDYRKYRAGFVEKLACAAVGAGAAGMVAWLFYRSVWGMLLFPAAYLVCVKKYCALKRKRERNSCSWSSRMPCSLHRRRCWQDIL